MAGIMLMLVGGKGGDAPVNTGAPVIDNTTPEYGETLTTTNGSWDSITTPTFTYQWQRNLVNISGATSSTYTVDTADVDARLNCRVTATNPFGSRTESTAQTSIVDAAPPDQVATPTAVAGTEEATVTWTELSYPTETGGVVLDRYQVLPSPATGGIRNASGSPFVVTGLIGGTSYTFTVRAENTDHSGPYSSASNSVTPSAPDIGLVMGGTDSSSSAVNYIEKIAIASTGNAVDWGDLTAATNQGPGSCGSSTRALNGGGRRGSSYTNVIDYGTFASSGNFSDFGDLTVSRGEVGAGNNSTRACWLGGIDTYSTSRIDYVTIATTGNASDFGDLPDHGYGLGLRYGNCLSSPTHIYYMGGQSGWDGQNFSDFRRITTATTGNAATYGGIGAQSNYNCGEGNSTTGLYHLPGTSVNSYTNTVYKMTYSTSGNDGDFGDLNYSQVSEAAATGNTTRVVFQGGRYSTSTPYYSDSMGYFTISTSGNSTTFGSLVNRNGASGAGASSNGGGVQ